MHEIMRGEFPLDEGTYTVDDLAERYDVHRDTVYKGIRAGSPLFPQASRKGTGPKAWLHFSAKAIRESDGNRVAFYKTTPSWHELFGKGAAAAPVRRAAAKVVRTLNMEPRLREKR